MRSFWFEKQIGKNWCIYFGKIYYFRLGITLGLQNELSLGFIVIGISKY